MGICCQIDSNLKPHGNPKEKIRIKALTERGLKRDEAQDSMRNSGKIIKSKSITTTDVKVAVSSELIVNCNNNSPNDSYQMIKKLGEGSYGLVWMVKHKRTGLIRAMKKISKNKNAKSETVKEIINEIELMRKLDHPNIVKIFEFFNEEDGFYLINEYCSGGELFDVIKKYGCLAEQVAANIMYQIFTAVNYCHKTNSIIHRDLKPENILIDSMNKDTGFYSIKIIDFGTAKIYEKNKSENKIIGSIYYIAPEVLMKNYNEKCDIWSCGVILYIILSGKMPFAGQREWEIIEKIKKGEYLMNYPQFSNVSDEAKDLIKKCLEKNPTKRLSAKEALNHPWFIKFNTKQFFSLVNEAFLLKTVDNIKKYKPKNKLQELVLTFLVHNLPELEEIKLVNKVYNLFNTSMNGKLTKEETQNALTKYLFRNIHKNKQYIQNQTEEIFSKLDNDNNGFIECEEFARAGIDKAIFQEVSVLQFAFDYLDKDKSGEISFDELRDVFKIKNKDLELMLRDIIKTIDQDGNGQISFKEFKDTMLMIIQ